MPNQNSLELEQQQKSIALLWEEKRDLIKHVNQLLERIKKLCCEAGHELVFTFNSLFCKTCNATLGWHCEASPIKVCQYNIDADPACDSCIWCGDPQERK